MIDLKRDIKNRLINDSTYLSLLGNPAEEPYKTFCIYPPQIPDFPFTVFFCNLLS